MKIKKSGFSMAELIITMAIVAIVAALILPSLRRLDGRTNQSKAEKIAGSIQNAVMEVMSIAQSNAQVSGGGIPETLSQIQNQDFEGTIYEESLFIPGSSLTMYDRMTNIFRVGRNTRRRQMNFFRAIQGKMGMEFINQNNLQDDYIIAFYAAGNLDNNTDIGFFRSNRYGAIVGIERAAYLPENNDDLSIALVRIIIDVNGEKGPNTNDTNNQNRDIFVYALGNNGNMYPEGTTAFDNNAWSTE